MLGDRLTAFIFSMALALLLLVLELVRRRLLAERSSRVSRRRVADSRSWLIDQHQMQLFRSVGTEQQSLFDVGTA